MVAYSATLAAYRRGLDPKALGLGRFAVLVALVAMAGILALRLGTVLVVDYSYSIAVPGDTMSFEGTEPITSLGVDLRAHIPDASAAVERLDLYLDLTSWLLVLSAAVALMGCVGVSALGMGGRSLRVHRALASPAVAVVLGLVALVFVGLAGGQLQDAAEGLYVFVPISSEDFSIDGAAGSGLIGALALAVIVVLLSVMYARILGRPMLMVAVGTAEPAPVEGEPMPVTAEGLPAGAPAPRMTPRSMVAVVVAIIVIISVAAGAYWLAGDGGGGDGDGEAPRVDIEGLEDFSLTFQVEGTGFLSEGSTMNHDLHVLFTSQFSDGATTHFVSYMEVTLTWEDEPDQQNPLATYENQPDTFALLLEDDEGGNNITVSDQGSNTHGQEGVVVVQWGSPGPWLAWGNTTLEVRDTYTVMWGLGVDVQVEMVEAGNLEAPRRPIAYVDSGNDYNLEVTVEGKLHTQG
jgi:hypothetical protein